MVHYVAGEGRTAGAQPVQQRSDIAEPARHPLHRLQDDPGLVAEVDTLTRPSSPERGPGRKVAALVKPDRA
jgi:hypothetical protein